MMRISGWRHEADRRLDAGAQTRRQRLAGQRRADRLLQRLEPRKLRGELRVPRHARLEDERIDRVQLAVEIGMDETGRAFARSTTRHAIFLDKTCSRRPRPRARRDITVPIGTPVTSAISRYDR